MKVKRILIQICRLGAVLLALPAKVQADFTFITNNGSITITLYTYGNDSGIVVIPSATNGLPVTAIGVAAFSNKTALVNIVIPNSVTNIGNCAFYNCNQAKITLGNGVTTIGDSAFHQCIQLTNGAVPGSVVNIGSNAFNNCSSLTSVTIPNSVTNIGIGAFSQCYALTNITVMA